MKIYKAKEIRRLASELLAKELFENEGYTFVNTSFGGGHGEVYCTLKREDRYGDHYIQYCFERSGDWESNTYTLVRHTEDKFWKTETRPFESFKNDTVIKTYYQVSRDSYDYAVYTDDEEYAKKANSTRYERYRNKSAYKERDFSFRERNIPAYSHLYNVLFTWMASKTGKDLKYGTEIKTRIYTTRDTERFNYDSNVYEKGTRVELAVGAVYRNKLITLNKTALFAKN